MFLFERKRLLCGGEALKAQGFPVEEHAELVNGTSSKLMHDLAGNAMSISVVHAVFTALWLAVPWTEKPPDILETGTADWQSAIGALSSSLAKGDDSDSD